ncbi:MAG: glycosyl transferase [Acetobacter sp.]
MTVPASVPLWMAFDPRWYRQDYGPLHPDLESLSDAALQHWYETQGALSGHSPNRYFSEEWYRLSCPEVMSSLATARYRSGFEHYCHTGFRTYAPHYLFSERLYRARYPDLTDTSLQAGGYMNGYDHFLRVGDGEQRSGHTFFDPVCYLRHRPAESALAALPPFEALLHSSPALPDTVRLSRHFDPAWYAALRPQAVQMVRRGLAPNLLHQFLGTFTPAFF